MNTILNILMRFLSVDTICTIIAKGISKILKYASKRGGKSWDKTKNIIKNIKVWCDLFLEVYDDDNLTPEEEQKIAEAIKNKTEIGKIVEIISK